MVFQTSVRVARKVPLQITKISVPDAALESRQNPFPKFGRVTVCEGSTHVILTVWQGFEAPAIFEGHLFNTPSSGTPVTHLNSIPNLHFLCESLHITGLATSEPQGNIN